MQIKNDKSEIRYTATEGQTEFIFDFPVFLSGHMVVWTSADDGKTWTKQTTGWSMAHTDADNKTGKVVFTAGLEEGVKVLLQRVVPLTQLSQYVEGDRLPAKVFEGDINIGIMIDQQHHRQLKKCFKLPDTSELENLTVPEPEEGKVLVWLSSSELGNMDLASIGAIVLPLPLSQGGTGATDQAGALAALGLTYAVKSNATSLLKAVFGDEAQTYTGTDLSGLTVARNHISWTLTAASTFSDVTLPYDGTYIIHVYPEGNTLDFAASYKTDGGLADADTAAGEVRITVEQFNGRKTIVSLQNMEA